MKTQVSVYQKIAEGVDEEKIKQWQVVATTLNPEVKVEVCLHATIDRPYIALHVEGLPGVGHLIMLRRPDGSYRLFLTEAAGSQWNLEMVVSHHDWSFDRSTGRTKWHNSEFTLEPGDWGQLDAVRENWEPKDYIRAREEALLVALDLPSVHVIDSDADAMEAVERIRTARCQLEQGQKAVEAIDRVFVALAALLDADCPTAPLRVLTRSAVSEVRGFAQLVVDELRPLLRLAAESLGAEGDRQKVLVLINLLKTSEEIRDERVAKRAGQE